MFKNNELKYLLTIQQHAIKLFWLITTSCHFVSVKRNLMMKLYLEIHASLLVVPHFRIHLKEHNSITFKQTDLKTPFYNNAHVCLSVCVTHSIKNLLIDNRKLEDTIVVRAEGLPFLGLNHLKLINKKGDDSFLIN